MTGIEFTALVEHAFTPFLGQLGFRSEEPHVSGRHYRCRFVGAKHTVTVAFEPGDGFLNVFLTYNAGDLAKGIDDRLKAPRLADLNRRYMPEITSSEKIANSEYFSSIVPSDTEEKQLLNAAKNLRLVLPRFVRDNT